MDYRRDLLKGNIINYLSDRDAFDCKKHDLICVLGLSQIKENRSICIGVVFCGWHTFS